MLFFVWEDGRVWAHWNHSFDMHLSYLDSAILDFPGGSDGKASAYNVGDPSSIPG